MILIFRIGSLGDSLVVIPALYHIKKRHPNEAITLVSNDPKNNHLSTWSIVQYTGIFDNVITYNVKNIFSIFKLILKIRGTKTKKTLYYLPPFRTEKQMKRDLFVFKNLAGINDIIGIKNSVIALASKDKNGNLNRLQSEYNRLLVAVLNESKNKQLDSFLPSTPLLVPTQDNYQSIIEILPQKKGTIFIAIAHGTNMQAKKWPLGNFIELLNVLNKKFNNITFIVIGGTEDYNEGEKIRKKINNCINLAGKTSIIESATLLEKCHLYIGNDTGAMHLSSIMGTPVVGIFSARDNPGKWEPYGKNNTLLRKQVSCEGCMLVDCIDEDKRCIKDISINEVYNSVLKYLIQK